MNFGCIIIEQVKKENLVIAIGDILKIISMNLIVTFVYKIFEYNKNTIRNQKHFKLISFFIGSVNSVLKSGRIFNIYFIGN